MNNNIPSPEEKEEDLQLVNILNVCWTAFRTHWIWFALSVAVCLCGGYLFQQCQPRAYQRQSVMLIEDADPSALGGNTTSRRSRSNMSSLLELNGISVGDNLKNEIFILTSNRLMRRVVDSLNLDVDYTVKSFLHRKTLYRERPFEVEFLGQYRVPVSLSVKKGAGDTFILSSFTRKGKAVDGTVTAYSGKPVRTPVGLLKVTRDAAISSFPEDKEVLVTRISPEIATNIFKAKVSAAEYDKESSLIVLTCQDANGGRAEDILNELFNAYKNDVVENKNRVANSTARFIDTRIDLIGRELGDVENRMADFKKRNRIVDFEKNADGYLTEGIAARKRRLEAETELTVANYLQEFLKGNSHKGEVIPQLAIANASFTQPISEYNKLVLQRNNMVENSSDNSPAVRDIDRQLESMRTSIVSSLNSYVRSVELELRDAQANENALTGVVGGVPEKEKQGLDIQRQQELKSALYTYLLNKREEVALQMAINEANVRLVENPIGSKLPVSPRKSIILLVSLVLGLAIPSAVLWLMAALDVTVKSRREVEAKTTIPIVGEVPLWEENEKDGSKCIITNCGYDEPIVESFRVLRYGLNFMRHSAKVFVVTSATPGQGKSFVSSNLAAILGMTGKRVLLVDADIRKRTLDRRFGHGAGLTAYLVDEENKLKLEDVIIKDAISEDVDFLPAGKLPPNPTELLMSDKLDELIEKARTQYDYVVVDTTPIISVADAGVVDRVADLTVFVLRIGVQESSFLPELEKMYNGKKLRGLCIALNGSSVQGNYGYGYGYGHSNKQKKTSKWNFLKR